MILSDIRSYIKQHRRVALMDMSNHFDLEPATLQGMLEKWIHKGKLRKLPTGASCASSGCCKCDPSQLELYEWLD